MGGRIAVVIGVIGFATGSARAQAVETRTAAVALRLGGIDAPAHAAFARPPDVVAGPGGQIFVRISSPPAIHVFGADGAYQSTIGREGEGPGEFRVASAHGLLADTLWVIDFPVPRLSLFLVDGTHLRTTRLPVIDHGRPFTAPQSVSQLMTGGGALAVPTAAPVGALDRTDVPVYRGDRALEHRDVVTRVKMPRGMYIPEVGSFALSPFARSPLVAVARTGVGYLIISWDDSASTPVVVSRYDASGRVVWRTDLDMPRQPVERRWLDSLVARGAEMARGPIESARRMGRGPAGDLEDVVEVALGAPDLMPPVRAAELGGDGSVWIHVGSGEWLVLDTDGDVAFRTSLPPSVSLTDVSIGSAWGTLLGELDVPYVVRFDLSR